MLERADGGQRHGPQRELGRATHVSKLMWVIMQTDVFVHMRTTNLRGLSAFPLNNSLKTLTLRFCETLRSVGLKKPLLLQT